MREGGTAGEREVEGVRKQLGERREEKEGEW